MNFGFDDWWALIGPGPRLHTSSMEQTSHDKTRRLAERQALGDVFLRPGEQLLVEYIRSEPRQLAGYLEHESWPIIVEGTTPSTTHLEHDVETAGRVVKAAVLCSLAWDEPWVVRSAPFRSDALPPSVPHNWPPPQQAFLEGPLALQLIAAYPEATAAVRLPVWLSDAWVKLEDERLWRSVLTWHEGLILQSEHPSFAAIAFTSSVESLSYSEWAKVEKRIPNSAGSRRRVAEMLESVIQSDVRTIVNAVYDARSSTAHGGKLFAYEASRGAFSALSLATRDVEGRRVQALEPQAGDQVQEFLQGVLLPLAQASRVLLLMALGGLS